jgi:anion-transporting  ArsA/GET3 family ATPase
LQIRFKRIFDIFVSNRFVNFFIRAVPGLNDLLMIGKIFYLEKQVEKLNPERPLYDLIIVDGPATGHGVSAFEVPSIVSRAVKVGPLKHQSDRILKLFTNSKKTAFSVVTLAEEMPVVETLELLDQVRDKLRFGLGPVFVNNFEPPFFSQEESETLEKKTPAPEESLYPYFAVARLASDRALLNGEYISLLKERCRGQDLIFIPRLKAHPLNAAALAGLADEWAGMMGH